MKRLTRSFFTKPTLLVAKAMLGKYLVRKMDNGNRILVGKIVETEAYIGPEDKASHAYKGKLTPRNRAEWLIGGHIYIYLVYGMYWQFNISTGKAGAPECVLIRALEPILGQSANGSAKGGSASGGKAQSAKNDELNKRLAIRDLRRAAAGPGRLCRWLKLDKSFYGEDVTKSKRIWLMEGEKISKSQTRLPDRQVAKGPRIGIDYAGPKWARVPWRFWIKSNPCVSA